MVTRTDSFDLSALRLSSGEGRRLELGLVIDPLELGGHTYLVTRAAEATAESGGGESVVLEGAPAELIPATLDISRMTGRGYALHLAFDATLHGPCMRCLEPADPRFSVESREVSQPGDGEELESPYVIESILDLGAWARDALVLALGATLLCRPDCLGLCPTCGIDLNHAGDGHAHTTEPDPRWAALADMHFDGAEAKAETEASPE